MNTPTPKTDKAWSCFVGYTEPLQDVKDLSHELECELTAMTEQRDRLQLIVDEGCRVSSLCREYREQRDKLAEILLDIMAYHKGDKPHDYWALENQDKANKMAFVAWQEILCTIEQALETKQ